VITRYNLFSDSKNNKLNEIAGIYDGYYGLTLEEFRMSDLYQITALFGENETMFINFIKLPI